MRVLDRGASSSAPDKTGNMALHTAAAHGASHVVECLLKKGVSALVKNRDRRTARQLAELGEHHSTIEVMDRTVARIREADEVSIRAQGVLGILLLKQQRLIEAQQQQLEQQEEEIIQLKQALAQKLEDFRGSQQRIVQALEAKAEIKAVDGLKARLAPLEALHEVELLCSQKLRVTPSSFTLHSSSPLLARPGRILEMKEDSKEVGELLQHVAYGEQKEAEAMIQKKPELLLCKGKVTDLSKREFKEITAFQYAVWALDWHMWRMLLKYLTKEEAWDQLKAWEGLGSHPHGKHASWQGLIDAYAAYYPNNYTSEYWIKQIGGSQLLLPAHVANEYCHGSRAFYPLPDFGNGGVELTRSRLSSGLDWYDVRCGKEWAHSRDNCGMAYHNTYLGYVYAGYDRAAVAALWETRQRQHVRNQSKIRQILCSIERFDFFSIINH